MNEAFTRTAILLGEESINKLSKKHVLIVGIGGVGGSLTEALARVGIGSFTLVDSDIVNLSNLNRQIIALNSTVSKYKVDVMKDRILDINPAANVSAVNLFLTPTNITTLDFINVDYIIDACDTLGTKIALVMKAKELGIMHISAMGAGNKLEPMRFMVSDISKTKVCPLAKAFRLELRKMNIKDVKVVYSDEIPIKNPESKVIGSISFVPNACGLLIAKEVVFDLLK